MPCVILIICMPTFSMSLKFSLLTNDLLYQMCLFNMCSCGCAGYISFRDINRELLF